MFPKHRLCKNPGDLLQLLFGWDLANPFFVCHRCGLRQYENERALTHSATTTGRSQVGPTHSVRCYQRGVKRMAFRIDTQREIALFAFWVKHACPWLRTH